MKLIDGDKLRNHLDYLIKKDTQFAKMCEGNDDFNRQRKYSFEANILAYELCQSVMDYYLVKNAQSANQWVSVKDRLPEPEKEVLVWYRYTWGAGFTAYRFGISRWYSNIKRWYEGCLPKDIEVLYWQPLPEPPKAGDTD